MQTQIDSTTDRLMTRLSSAPATIADLHRETGMHRLIITGRLETLHELGHIDRMRVGPAWLYYCSETIAWKKKQKK